MITKYPYAIAAVLILLIANTGAAQQHRDQRALPVVPLVPVGPSDTTPETVEMPLEAALHQDDLLPRMIGAVAALDLPLRDVVSLVHFAPAHTHSPDTRTYRTDSGIVLRVHIPTARVVTFRDEGRLAVLRRNTGEVDAAQAMAVANRSFEKLGLGAQVKRTHLGEERSLDGVWRFHVPTGVEGIPCGGGYRIWVNGEGRVVLYSDGPACVRPPSLKPELSQRQADRAASGVLRQQFGRRGVRSGRSHVELRVVHPNNVWQAGAGRPHRVADESRLAWVVAYPDLRINGAPRPATIFIDARDGSVLGGVR